MPLLNESARGVYVIAVTPFTDDGALDLASVPGLVDFYLGAGADGLTLLGVLGEAPKLTADEGACPSSLACPAPAWPRWASWRARRWPQAPPA